MKTTQILFWLLAFVTTIHALTVPESFKSFSEASQSLYKRKGGGGGRGGGGGSSGGGSRGGGSTSTGGSSSGSSGRGSSGSNTGGRTTTGSGTPKSFGNSYAGGASVPYRSGSVQNGIQPRFIGAAALGFFPGLWLYGVYAYNFNNPWTYHNRTSNQNMTLPVQCLCEDTVECGCEENSSSDYQNAVANNQTLSRVATVNGTQTLFINGTLENGTTADGGDEDAFTGAASSLYKPFVELSGFWVVVGGVVYSLWFM